MIFTSIYERYRDEMEKTALGMLKRQHDAEDAVQNAFENVIKHFEDVYTIPGEKLIGWLITIVKNEARMILRKRNREVPLEDLEDLPETVSDITSEDILCYHELVALVRKLPEKLRPVLEMKMLLGYRDREIAEHLGISETAVSSRATRGRQLLREIVEKEGYRHDGPGTGPADAAGPARRRKG